MASKPVSGARKTKAARPRAEFNSAAVKRSLALLIPFVVFLFLGLTLIWERVKVRELAAQIATLDSQRIKLIEQNGKLRIQLEQMSSYSRISRIATQRLGLVAVPQHTILVQEE
ncbi:MAG: cell division protein FtsL [candidate division KSB1 bacterium]|nr:cell division protein FtsL [candidate division KSB1 bacterium]